MSAAGRQDAAASQDAAARQAASQDTQAASQDAKASRVGAWTTGGGSAARTIPHTARRLVAAAIAAMAASVALGVTVGVLGPSAAVPAFSAAPPWPPYFITVHPSDAMVAVLSWLAAALGGVGLILGLLAARKGWRPTSARLLAGCLIAVIALLVVPPVGSTDMMDYAIYGRIAALHHSPYTETPAQLQATRDPVGLDAPVAWRTTPSVYGPIATLSEHAASALAGPSMAKTLFWLKFWNALAFLAVALALDRLFRGGRVARDADGDAGQRPGGSGAARVRAHLLWTVNPLMWWAVIAGGHIDVLAAAFGFLGLIALRRVTAGRGLAAGLLTGVAIAIKAPFVAFGAGLAWVARRSPRTLAALTVGAVIVVTPAYWLTGRAAINSVYARGTGGADLYQPWQLVTRVLLIHKVSDFSDVVAAAATIVLIVILLRGLPDGPPTLPQVRPALALSLAWLVCSPQQRPWFDAMLFPVLALMPATRLDWIVAGRALAGALAELPGVKFWPALHPLLIKDGTDLIARNLVPLSLWVLAGALIWLCVTRRWVPPGGAGSSMAQVTDSALRPDSSASVRSCE